MGKFQKGKKQGYVSCLSRIRLRDFLAVQWLRTCLVMQGTWVQLLVGELSPHAKEAKCHHEDSARGVLKTCTAKIKEEKEGQ